ncbi:glycoside hydrolase family 3 protein [Ilyonectria robusta]|uniref:glycoside hydrolase family 3 protein n=1 Tax=Ilyonectria robusta TaxID=1079257 RepID=UPI001E8DF03C|nr:glycoside hydrolase family 3 protein [Ilyonectria robusta]KAH8684175.1 glycoside hydrolase family 3 protein [Ilyonectria robusta]
MADINVEETLKKLSLGEKVSLLAGVDFWHTKALPDHGVPSLRLTDGPNGVRGTKFFNGIPAACFPCGTALGATFNKDLLEEAGKKMGEEAIAKNAHVILGPTINMQRSPLGGRGFESIGEDPFLSGLGAAALIRGIQSTGVQATIKHFLCNDHEHKRQNVQAIVSERALREIYALPFQLTVRDAQPGAFMTGYNGINGTFCSENPKVLDDMLRKEWGWDGMVMSDWFGTYTTSAAVKAGLDLEMPGPTKFRGDLLKFNVNTGKVWGHEIDNRAREVLKLVKKCAATGIKETGPDAPERTLDTPETAALLRKIGDESIVLLKNDNNVLPLAKEKKTLVIGPNAKVATYHGGGSASLAAYYAVTPYDGIAEKLGSQPQYSIGAYTHKLLPLLGPQTQVPSGKPGMTWNVYATAPGTPGRESVDQLELTKTEMHLVDFYNPKVEDLWYADLEGTLVAEEDGPYEFSLIVSGTANLYVNGDLVIDNSTKQVAGDAFFGCATQEERGIVNLKKGESYKVKVEFASAPSFTLALENTVVGHGSLRVGGCKVIDDQAEIKKSVQLAKEHDQVIICAGLNADWETEATDRASMKLPGVLDQLIAEVAAANPNTTVVMQTGTPEEMPWLDQVSAVIQAWYGGNETGNCIADVLFGDYNPSGKLSLSFPKRLQDVPAFLNFRTEAGRVLYGEDIYIGYRYYEFAEREVNYPFGHGLSYTTFEFSDLAVASKEGKLSVSLKIKNTGSIKGAEVAQLYIQPKQAAKVNRPVKELKGFAKAELEAGQTKTVTIEELEKYAASYFDEERNQWCVEAGEYEVVVSDSSAAKEGKTLKGSFKVAESYWWSGL